MAEDTNKPAHAEGGAARRPDVGDKQRDEPGKTGAGQEARRGIPPGDHDHEHQSNYGGGGVNGGTSSDKR